MNTVLLDDGYNGSKVLFNTNPLEVDGDLVKLSCAEPGKEYLIRWVLLEDVIKAQSNN